VTLRAGQSVVAFALVAGVAVLLVANAALGGRWSEAAAIAGTGVLVVWAAWMLLVRPSIRVRPDRAVVVNVGRVTEVPWSRVVDIKRRLQLVLELDDGRSVECWGSPFPNRRSRAEDPAADVVRAAWLSADSVAVGPVVRRVDILALTLGAVALAAAVYTWIS
jgi:hypothetical protein